MDVRFGLLIILVLGGGWACDARHMAATDLPLKSMVISHLVPVMTMKSDGQQQQTQGSGMVVKNNQVCTLCEEFTAQALGYLSENKTQTEIIDVLHEACSRVPTFTQQCITMVDYYAPLFFVEISSIQPETFCQKVNLCQKIVNVFVQVQEDSCRICHRAMSEVILKLKDPDTQLEIIELLLKACSSMDNHATKCKKMVFEYGPLVLANAEQFLETTDVCTMLHACATSGQQASTLLKADS